jgi:hypothetical protein
MAGLDFKWFVPEGDPEVYDIVRPTFLVSFFQLTALPKTKRKFHVSDLLQNASAIAMVLKAFPSRTCFLRPRMFYKVLHQSRSAFRKTTASASSIIDSALNSL